MLPVYDIWEVPFVRFLPVVSSRQRFEDSPLTQCQDFAQLLLIIRQ